MDIKSKITDEKMALNLDTNFLKLVAIIAMTCDHIGKALFPQILILQIIGRIAFPIFAYCLVVGVLYTHDIKKYLLRLTAFAVISQPFSVLSGHPTFADFIENIFILNIFFTLIVGLVILYGIKERKWILVIGGIIVACFVNLDYGMYGIVLMIIFYVFRDKPKLAALMSAISLAMPFINEGELLILGRMIDIQGFAVLALPLIFTKTNFKPRINKYFFYIYYPVHLFAIYLIRVIYGI